MVDNYCYSAFVVLKGRRSELQIRPAPWPTIAMPAFDYERDLDHHVSAEVEQTIRDILQELLRSQGLEGVLVNPDLGHVGDPVLFVHLNSAS